MLESSSLIKQYWIDSIIPRLPYSDKIQRLDRSSSVCFYVNVINHKPMSIVSIDDSMVYLFRNESGKWMQTDSLTFIDEIYSIAIKALNGDQCQDVIISGYPNVNLNCASYLLISDKNGYLHFQPNNDLSNVTYDPIKKLIRSSRTGSFCFNRKEVYQWRSDSLVLVRGAIQENLEWVTFYRPENGKPHIYKKIKDENEKIWDTAIYK